VQCTGCKKYVHGTCDPEADLTAYQTKKATTPDYTYSCPVCKQYSSNRKGLLLKRNSLDDVDQDSCFFGDDSLSGMDMDGFDRVRLAQFLVC
jgi:hypothetical protein